MDVRMFWNTARPGVGLKPRRESQRPQLPQHARHCPALEAGSGLGFLVYPPLEPFESFYIGYYGEGRYQFVYYFRRKAPTGSRSSPSGRRCPWVASASRFAGGRDQADRRADVARGALLVMRKFIVPDDLGTPPGAVTLRGATNFRTPAGWDTVYTSVFNAIERPAPPVMVVRVETDWYTHETEFRYVLQPGEGISAARTMPIGQVFFVPWERSPCSSARPRNWKRCRSRTRSSAAPRRRPRS